MVFHECSSVSEVFYSCFTSEGIETFICVPDVLNYSCSSSAGVEAFHRCSSVSQVFYNCCTSVCVKAYYRSSSVPQVLLGTLNTCSPFTVQ